MIVTFDEENKRYSFVFDRSSVAWIPDEKYNLAFVQSVFYELKYRMEVQGYLTLTEVVRAIENRLDNPKLEKDAWSILTTEDNKELKWMTDSVSSTGSILVTFWAGEKENKNEKTNDLS